MEYFYKKFRNKVVTEIRKSKNDYYSQYFAGHKSNKRCYDQEYALLLMSNRMWEFKYFKS